MNFLLFLAFLLLPQGRGVTPSTGTITGQLRSPDKGAVAQVRVSAMFADDGAGKVTQSVRADNDGRFRLDALPPGRYYVFAGPEEYPFYYPGATTGKDARVVYVAAGGTTPGIDFQIRRIGVRIAGHVLDDRVNILGAPLQLVAPDGIAAHTNLVDNRFEFTNVLPGLYRIEAPEGLELNPIQVQVSHENITGLRMTTPSAKFYSVSGRILNLVSGRPLAPGQQVTLTPVSINRVPAEGVINSDGAFTIRDMMPGVYSVSSGQALVLSPGSIEVVDRDISGVEVRMIPQLEATLHTVSEDGLTLPLPMSIYKFSPTAGKSGPEAIILEQQPTAVAFGENYLFLRVPPTLSIKSMKSGNRDLLKQPLIVEPSAKEIAIEVVVGANPTGNRSLLRISGRVRGARTGLRIRIVDTLLPDDIATIATREQPVNTDGSFEFLVEAGIYRLELPDTAASIAEVIVLGKDVSGVELRLRQEE